MPPCVVEVIARVVGEPVAVKLAGPVHERLEPVALNVSVLPVHIGFGLAVTLVGAAGVVGSVKVTGPAKVFDAHEVPLKVILILVYVPAVKPEIVITPLPFEVSVTVVGLPPFLV